MLAAGHGAEGHRVAAVPAVGRALQHALAVWPRQAGQAAGLRQAGGRAGAGCVLQRAAAPKGRRGADRLQAAGHLLVPLVLAALRQRRQQDVQDAALLAAHHQRRVGRHLNLQGRAVGEARWVGGVSCWRQPGQAVRPGSCRLGGRGGRPHPVVCGGCDWLRGHQAHAGALVRVEQVVVPLLCRDGTGGEGRRRGGRAHAGRLTVGPCWEASEAQGPSGWPLQRSRPFLPAPPSHR
jgi:hypothetical protein